MKISEIVKSTRFWIATGFILASVIAGILIYINLPEQVEEVRHDLEILKDTVKDDVKILKEEVKEVANEARENVSELANNVNLYIMEQRTIQKERVKQDILLKEYIDAKTEK